VVLPYWLASYRAKKMTLRALSVNRSNMGLMNCTGQYPTREVYLRAKVVYF
jgi:hypothetical protein